MVNATATNTEVQSEFTRILDQGTAAVQRVVRAYEAARTPERDLHWLCLQTGKEFGAVTLQHSRAMDVIDGAGDVGAVRAWAHAIEEEIEHYEGYARILERLLADGSAPVEGMYDYVRVSMVGGHWVLHDRMVARKDRWPDNHAYFVASLDAMETLGPWARRAVAAQFEGGAVGWHWAMSEMGVVDEFTEAVTATERAIVADELHHGPEDIRPLVEAYTPAQAEEVAEVFRIIRELRYLEVRERNEQFLHPLSEAELAEIRAGLADDSLEPVSLFTSAVG